jgi:hypothetical protein
LTGSLDVTQNITASNALIENDLIVSGTFDIEGKIIVNDNVIVNGNLSVNGGTSLTGSLAVTQNITASNAFITNDLNVGGTLFASKVVTLIESSSIIYSSGSNILGDATSDTQTLIGSVIMSGSASLTGSLGVSNNISSSTISGIGNVTLYSQSVDSRLVFLEVPFSTSVDARIDALENFSSSTFNAFSTSVDNRLDIVEATASLYVPFSTSVDSRLDVVEATASLYVPFSTSVDNRLDVLESWSSSLQIDFATQAELTVTASILQSNINTKLDTSSFNAYTQSYSSSVASTITSLSTSVDSRLDLVESTVTTLNSYTSSNNSRWNVLDAKTGSYATTGSNNFVGNQSITGSLILSSSAAVELTTIGNSVFSGSVSGRVIPITIASNTASMDCSLGNFFTLTLGSASNTRLIPTNIQPGETISLRITQPATTGSLTYASSIKFPATLGYSASIFPNAIDILTFVSYDSTNLFSVAVKNMQ